LVAGARLNGSNPFADLYGAGRGEKLIRLIEDFGGAVGAEVEAMFPTVEWDDAVRFGLRAEVIARVGKQLAELVEDVEAAQP
jgi:hypothetical protein